MATPARPLSPHLQVYRWQIGNTLSILHRLSGLGLSLGLLALCFWLASVAGGQTSYQRAVVFFGNPLGLVALALWSLAFNYHLLNGIRHLFWDMGKGFERRERHASGWFVVIASLALTAVTWAIAAHIVRG
jgi:succinate dehydrogenase / fumarate reductase, cytochrome b subunit